MDVAAITGIRPDPSYTPPTLVRVPVTPDSSAGSRPFSSPAPASSAGDPEDEVVHAPADPSAKGFWKLSDIHAATELLRQRSSARAAVEREHAAEQAQAEAAAEARTADKAAPAVTAVRATQLAAWRKAHATSKGDASAPKDERRPEPDEGETKKPELPRYL